MIPCWIAGGRSGPADVLIFGLTLSFVVGKKEELVFEDGPADRDAEVVADELGGMLGRPLLNWACLLNQSLATVSVGPVVPVSRAVIFVGSRLGDHADLRTGRAALIGVGKTGGYAELFDRVLGFTQHTGEGIAIHLVVVVDTVDGDIALVGPAAVDRAAAAVVA